MYCSLSLSSPRNASQPRTNLKQPLKARQTSKEEHTENLKITTYKQF